MLQRVQSGNLQDFPLDSVLIDGESLWGHGSGGLGASLDQMFRSESIRPREVFKRPSASGRERQTRTLKSPRFPDYLCFESMESVESDFYSKISGKTLK